MEFKPSLQIGLSEKEKDGIELNMRTKINEMLWFIKAIVLHHAKSISKNNKVLQSHSSPTTKGSTEFHIMLNPMDGPHFDWS